MDKTTHDVRLANWKAVIERCQSRPQGQRVKDWLVENQIPEKQYYYWLRKVRLLAYQEMHASLPAVTNTAAPAPVAFAEFSGQDLWGTKSNAAVTIKTSKSTIEISSDISETLMVKLVKAVAHAL